MFLSTDKLGKTSLCPVGWKPLTPTVACWCRVVLMYTHVSRCQIVAWCRPMTSTRAPRQRWLEAPPWSVSCIFLLCQITWVAGCTNLSVHEVAVECPRFGWWSPNWKNSGHRLIKDTTDKRLNSCLVCVEELQVPVTSFTEHISDTNAHQYVVYKHFNPGGLRQKIWQCLKKKTWLWTWSCVRVFSSRPRGPRTWRQPPLSLWAVARVGRQQSLLRLLAARGHHRVAQGHPGGDGDAGEGSRYHPNKFTSLTFGVQPKDRGSYHPQRMFACSYFTVFLSFFLSHLTF